MPISNPALFPIPLHIFLLSLLVFTFLISAISTTILRQVYTVVKAVKTERSYHKKRAIQALELSFVVFSILFFASAIDVGFAHTFFSSLDHSVYNVIIYLPIFLSFSLFLARYWFRALKTSEENKVHWLWAITTSFCAIKSMGLIVVSAYFTFYANPFVGPHLPLYLVDPNSSFAPILEFYAITSRNIYGPIFAYPLHCIYMLTFFTLAGICIGYGLQIFYTLVCKSNDNFGRDYYNLALKEYSKNAAIALVLLIILILPTLSGNFLEINLKAFSLNHTILLLFPLTCILYGIIARSANPLRHKISITLCPIFLLIASVFFVLYTL